MPKSRKWTVAEALAAQSERTTGGKCRVGDYLTVGLCGIAGVPSAWPSQLAQAKSSKLR